MPAAYTFWILMPTNFLGNTVSWALFPIIFAFLCGDLRRSLFTAFFYIGMEASIDATRSSFIAMVFGQFFKSHSPEQYLQYNLQYLLVFAASLYYYNVMKPTILNLAWINQAAIGIDKNQEGLPRNMVGKAKTKSHCFKKRDTG